MGIFYVDGFEQFSDNGGDTPHNGSGWWTSNVSQQDPGRFGYGKCMVLAFGSTGLLLQQPRQDILLGFAVRWTQDVITGGVRRPMEWFAGDQRQFALWTRADGSVFITRNDDSNQIKLDTPAGTFRTGPWQYVEIGSHHDSDSDTGSTIFLRVNGVEVGRATGVNLRNGSNAHPDRIQFGWSNQTLVDDMYLSDDLLTPLGDCRVTTLPANADTAQADWTGNASMIDELPWNKSDYISSGVVGAKSEFDLLDLPAGAATIHALRPLYYAGKDDAAVRDVRAYLKSGASVANGTTNAMPSDFQQFSDPVVTSDPATSAPWTTTAVNALKIGLEVVT